MTKEKVCADLQIFVDLCREQGLVPLLPQEICTEYNCEGYDLQDVEALRKLDFAVSLGGDGTLLKMALYLAPLGIPAFGVNFGKLGFLAEIDQPSMRKAIMRLVRGDYSLENRSLLRAQVMLNDECIKEVHALNDLVLAKGAYSKMAHMQMYINGKPSGSYAADGLIVATATGSTAYSLSCGGPLVQPELEVSVITPICAHSLTARTLIIPMSEVIELKAVPGSEDMMLEADGESIIGVSNDTYLRIDKSPYTMKLIRLTSRDYYQTWQQKLMRNI
ncbi:MAG: NAD(+)/NADH kinase [Phascolarctobacterium sp.]|nr:NAD(+)/NADH kinase [Phascolarctobacterium sp.]